MGLRQDEANVIPGEVKFSLTQKNLKKWLALGLESAKFPVPIANVRKGRTA